MNGGTTVTREITAKTATGRAPYRPCMKTRKMKTAWRAAIARIAAPLKSPKGLRPIPMSNSTMRPSMRMPETATYFASSNIVTTSQQIQQREEEDPDRVDHPPVDPEHLDRSARLRRRVRLDRLHHQVNQGDQAGHDVRTMHAGEDVVDARSRAGPEGESPGEELLPLQRFVHHEERAKGERRDQRPLQSDVRSPPGEREREDHREPARQQQDRVEPTEGDVVDLSRPRPHEVGQRAVHPEERVGADGTPHSSEYAPHGSRSAVGPRRELQSRFANMISWDPPKVKAPIVMRRLIGPHPVPGS